MEAVGHGLPFVEDTLASTNESDIGMAGVAPVTPRYFNYRKHRFMLARMKFSAGLSQRPCSVLSAVNEAKKGAPAGAPFLWAENQAGKEASAQRRRGRCPPLRRLRQCLIPNRFHGWFFADAENSENGFCAHATAPNHNVSTAASLTTRGMARRNSHPVEHGESSRVKPAHNQKQKPKRQTKSCNSPKTWPSPTHHISL